MSSIQDSIHSIEISVKEITNRLHTKEEFYSFFVHINQRLLPKYSEVPPEFFLQLLTGEKKCLRLLDSRFYYFPEAFLTHPLLSPESLISVASQDTNLLSYIPFNCKDQQYLIKILATLSVSFLIDIDNQLQQIYKSLSSFSYLY